MANKRKRRRSRRRKSSGSREDYTLRCSGSSCNASLVIIIGWNKGVRDDCAVSDTCRERSGYNKINSPFEILIDARSGKTLGENGAEKQFLPRALTKIMTAIVAIRGAGKP